jgi:DNA-nicking Smr family endonuclease
MTMAEIRTALREAFGIMPTLDLHGLGVRRAREEADRFLREAQSQGLGSVRIVYGKGRHSPRGRGALRPTILEWLDTTGRAYVRRYERRPDSSGEDGAVVVWVRLPEEE